MYLVDTNVLLELRRPQRAARRVLEWADGVSDIERFISAVTIMELEIGCLRAMRCDVPHGRVLDEWLRRQILPSFAGRILPIDSDVALRCAALHVPDPKPDRDALIGATALVRGLTVVTRNVADFRSMGVPLLNPWDV